MKLPPQPQPPPPEQRDLKAAIRADVIARLKGYTIVGTVPVMGPTRGVFVVNLNAVISEEQARKS